MQSTTITAAPDFWRVDADHIPVRADIAGPGCICHSEQQAQEMAERYRARKDLQNVSIRPIYLKD